MLKNSRLSIAVWRLREWCDTNDLHLNLNKCSVLTISNKHASNIIKRDYRYGDHVFSRVHEQKDLGVIIDSKMNFVSHKTAIISKAISTLGFIKRICYHNRDPRVLRTLFTSLMVPILEYCSIVWLPSTQIWIDRIESVQKQFAMFAFRE